MIGQIISTVFHSLRLSLYMFWDTLWPLALGFLISAIVQTLVSKKTVAEVLGQNKLKNIAFACGFGAASSSCSYAAVSVSRTLFRKGASFSNAIIFEFASTNLVFELGLVILILLGWQFLAAEFIGGLVMIAILAVIFKLTLTQKIEKQARKQAEKGLLGKMEGHGSMDMSISSGSFFKRLFSPAALTAVSHYFFMDIYSIYTDLLLGFLLAGFLGTVVPNSFWLAFFLTHNHTLAAVWGPIIGPVISMLSFVCSVGNVPLAAILWNGGISFGGAISFIFADLIILPILNIYRKYYGKKVSIYLLGISYLSMVLTGFLIQALFQALHILPAHTTVQVLQSSPSLNYTSVLNFLFVLLMIFLGIKFLNTGGPTMLATMDVPRSEDEDMVKDLACGMMVNSKISSHRSTYKDRKYYFCSSSCKKEFDKDPQKYFS